MQLLRFTAVGVRFIAVGAVATSSVAWTAPALAAEQTEPTPREQHRDARQDARHTHRDARQSARHEAHDARQSARQDRRDSNHEVRDELRQHEGSPEVKGRLRAAQRDTSRLRMLAEVARADVVVRNPTHYAVALRYERVEMRAPRVVARGRNQVAQRILEVARENGIPIVENAGVARLLYRTARVGKEIPEALYEAIAEILAYVYRIDRRRGSAWMGAS